MCPPETTSTTAGSGSGPLCRNSDSMCPARWWTRHQRHAERQRDRLRDRHADQQRADQARALGHRNRVDVLPRRARFGERALEHAADVAHVLARRQLRHDAAPLAMDRDLRGDDARSHPPRLRRIAGLLDDGRRRLVARAFDAEDMSMIAMRAVEHGRRRLIGVAWRRGSRRLPRAAGGSAGQSAAPAVRRPVRRMPDVIAATASSLEQRAAASR